MLGSAFFSPSLRASLSTLMACASQIPNNAQLELVKTDEKRFTASSVRIAVELSSGKRYEGQFPPTTTLWNILKTIEPQVLEAQRQAVAASASPIGSFIPCFSTRRFHFFRVFLMFSTTTTVPQALTTSSDPADDPQGKYLMPSLRFLQREVCVFVCLLFVCFVCCVYQNALFRESFPLNFKSIIFHACDCFFVFVWVFSSFHTKHTQTDIDIGRSVFAESHQVGCDSRISAIQTCAAPFQPHCTSALICLHFISFHFAPFLFFRSCFVFRFVLFVAYPPGSVRTVCVVFFSFCFFVFVF